MYARGLKRAGASRKLSSFVVRSAPDILAVSAIEPGDALSLATRFARQWAYRGGQALFWNARFEAAAIEGLYLPAAAPLQLERRGFLRVDGALDGNEVTLAATQFHSSRGKLIPELRFARAQLRACAKRAFLFGRIPHDRLGIADLGFRQIAQGVIWVRPAAHEGVAGVSVTI